MRSFCIAIIAALILAAPAPADPQSVFEEGLAQYRADNWEQAVTVWEDLVEDGYVSGPLYYNLGNAYYRLNELGQSVLAYERAQELMPRDADVQNNLELVRLSVVDRIEAPVRLSIWNWIDSIRDSLTTRELAGWLQVLGLLLAGLIAARFFVALKFRRSLRPVLAIGIVLYALLIGWYGWSASLAADDHAIIMAEKVEVYSGPDDSSTQLFSLHEGTRIETREELADWMRIRLADGREGWLRRTEIEII